MEAAISSKRRHLYTNIQGVFFSEEIVNCVLVSLNVSSIFSLPYRMPWKNSHWQLNSEKVEGTNHDFVEALHRGTDFVRQVSPQGHEAGACRTRSRCSNRCVESFGSVMRTSWIMELIAPWRFRQRQDGRTQHTDSRSTGEIKGNSAHLCGT